MENSNSHAFCAIAKLTVIGSVFVGVGAVLNHTVPAFRAPVQWVDIALKRTGDHLGSLPGTQLVFQHNPLSENATIREFLAINIVESILIGGVIVGAGAAMKLGGIKPRHIDEWLSTNHSSPPRS